MYLFETILFRFIGQEDRERQRTSFVSQYQFCSVNHCHKFSLIGSLNKIQPHVGDTGPWTVDGFTNKVPNLIIFQDKPQPQPPRDKLGLCWPTAKRPVQLPDEPISPTERSPSVAVGLLSHVWSGILDCLCSPTMNYSISKFVKLVYCV